MADNPASPMPTSGDLKTGAQNMRVMLTFFLAGFAATFLLCVGLVIHMRRNRSAALKGDSKAAAKIILPAFEPLLILLGVVNGAYVFFLIVTLATGYYDGFVPPLVLESFYCGNVFDFVVVLVLLMQKSISIQALGRTVCISLILSSHTMPYTWYVTTRADHRHRELYLVGHFLLHLLSYLPFVYAFIHPPSRATRRTIRELCVFALIHYAMSSVVIMLLIRQSTIAISRYVMFSVLAWVSLTPLVIWRVLRADTNYWRGLGERTTALRDLVLHGHSIQEHASARGLHVLIEAHRKNVIDFAYLDLEHQIGVGSTSNVFKGTLKAKTPVAIKVYSPDSVTEDILAAFSHEAAMCASLRHPNVVSFLGLCVSPPTVCLVFELCQGNLDDVMCAHARRKYHPARQQMLINVGYMLDAARAVAYLHSFSPPCLHRDIQPANFLVDSECTVKLADFGQSRGLATLTTRVDKNYGMEFPQPYHTKIPSGEKIKTDYGLGVETMWRATVAGSGASAYLAPELQRADVGAAGFGQAADIYALGVTMADILYPLATNFHGSVPITRASPRNLHRQVPLALRNLVNSMIRQDSRSRPTAPSVVLVLEELQFKLSVDAASRMMAAMCPHDQRTGPNEVCNMGSKMDHFNGVMAADWMVEQNYVSSLGESVRMGNSFMDAGQLHHSSHSQCFENSDEYYMFDPDSIQGGQLPRASADGVAVLGLGVDAADQPHRVPFADLSIPILSSANLDAASQSSRSCIGILNNECVCRRLAQGLDSAPIAAKSSRFKLRSFPPVSKEVTAIVIEEDIGEDHEFGRMKDYGRQVPC